jgi:hypothetical protein
MERDSSGILFNAREQEDDPDAGFLADSYSLYKILKAIQEAKKLGDARVDALDGWLTPTLVAKMEAGVAIQEGKVALWERINNDIGSTNQFAYITSDELPVVADMLREYGTNSDGTEWLIQELMKPLPVSE